MVRTCEPDGAPLRLAEKLVNALFDSLSRVTRTSIDACGYRVPCESPYVFITDDPDADRAAHLLTVHVERYNPVRQSGHGARAR